MNELHQFVIGGNRPKIPGPLRHLEAEGRDALPLSLIEEEVTRPGLVEYPGMFVSILDRLKDNRYDIAVF